MIRADRLEGKKPHRGEVQTPDFRILFEAVPDPCLVLDRELRILAANDAYLRVTRTTREAIVGLDIFDVFPENPDDPTASGPRKMGESMRRVLKEGKAEHLAVQRYDIPTPEGGFAERYWSALNTPVFDADGHVVYIIHRVQDITDFITFKRGSVERMKANQELRARVEEVEAEVYTRSQQMSAANEALRESKHLFDAFMAELPAAAWMKDTSGRYVWANAAMERLFGVPVRELLGKSGAEVFSPETAAQFAESDRRVLAQGMSDKLFQVVRQAGEGERYLMITKFPILRENGEPELVAGLAFDVTESKRMEAEIARLASYPLLNPNPIIEIGLDGAVKFCNPAAKRILEDGECADPGRNSFIPDNLPTIIKDLRDHNVPYYFQQVEVRGKIFEELFTLLPQNNTVRCYTMDITERKKAEDEREELLLKLEAVLENINEGVVISDLAGNLLTMNRQALDLHEYESVEQVRRHMTEFQDRFELHDLRGRQLTVEEWPLKDVLRGEHFVDRELKVNSKHSGRNWIWNYSGTPIFNKDGTPMLAVLTVRDITDKKLLEEQITKLNADLAARVAELEVSNQELEGFNRMVSHDLRQPLNVIGTSCQAIEMLCGDCLDEDCKKYVRMAYDRVVGMSSLITSLLNFSRSSHTPIKREDVDLSEMARVVAAGLNLAEPERRARFLIPAGIKANGDPGLLRSVLENLIGNAWKYSANRDETRIEFGLTRVNEETAYYVRDNGNGFDMADADKLFAPFTRLPGSEQFRGFGIGLATVERIVRRHGGRVWAESAPGQGATFYFTLPNWQ